MRWRRRRRGTAGDSRQRGERQAERIGLLRTGHQPGKWLRPTHTAACFFGTGRCAAGRLCTPQSELDRCVHCAGTGRATYASTPIPIPRSNIPRDAIIKISACAICGSDLHPLRAARRDRLRNPVRLSPARPRCRPPGCPRQVLGELAQQLALQRLVVVLAQLAQRLGRRDDDQVVDAMAEHFLVEPVGGGGGEAVFLEAAVVRVAGAARVTGTPAPLLSPPIVGSGSAVSLGFASSPVLRNRWSLVPSATATVVFLGSCMRSSAGLASFMPPNGWRWPRFARAGGGGGLGEEHCDPPGRDQDVDSLDAYLVPSSPGSAGNGHDVKEAAQHGA